MSVMLVWAHSWGKKVEMSLRASGAERRVVLSLASVGGMMDWVMYERSLFELGDSRYMLHVPSF